MPILATIPLFAGIFALALGAEHPEDAVSVLYAIPIAILAIEGGPIAGLGAAAVGLALFGLDVAISDEHVSALAFVTRAIGFGVLGGLLGHYASSLRAANSEVVAREELLLSILDNTTAVIYMKDRKGRYMLINRRFEELYHVTRDGAIGKTAHDLFPQYMADAYVANDRRVLKELQPIEFEEEAPQDDGPHTFISIKFPLVRQGEREPMRSAASRQTSARAYAPRKICATARIASVRYSTRRTRLSSRSTRQARSSRGTARPRRRSAGPRARRSGTASQSSSCRSATAPCTRKACAGTSSPVTPPS